MPTKLLGAAAMLTVLPVGAVLAQSEAPTAPDPGMGTPVIPEAVAPGAGSVLAVVSPAQLLGREVVDLSGESVGVIQDVLYIEDTEIGLVMVDVGGFLGIGERTVPIDTANLMLDDAGNLVASLSKEEIHALPAFELRDGAWERAAE